MNAAPRSGGIAFTKPTFLTLPPSVGPSATWTFNSGLGKQQHGGKRLLQGTFNVAHNLSDMKFKSRTLDSASYCIATIGFWADIQRAVVCEAVERWISVVASNERVIRVGASDIRVSLMDQVAEGYRSWWPRREMTMKKFSRAMRTSKPLPDGRLDGRLIHGSTRNIRMCANDETCGEYFCHTV